MQPLAEAIAAAARTVLVNTSVVSLRFGLLRLATGNDVVHLHIVVGRIIDVLDQDACGRGTVRHIALVTSAKRPLSNHRVVDDELDLFATTRAARTYCDGTCAATRAGAGTPAARART